MARLFVSASSTYESNKGTRWLHSVVYTSRLLAIAGMLALAPTFGADKADAKTNSNDKGKVTRDEDTLQTNSAPIPESIAKLNLTTKQQEQIREIVREYDRSINSVWNHYRDRYMQTIVAESSLLAAIEDGLSDAQRQQIRDHRRKTAQHKKLTVAADDQPDSTKEKPDGKTVEVEGVLLSKEQEAAADKIHQNYRSHLRSLNRDVHRLHNRLLALEADKLVEIENLLTKEQLIQLRSIRQSAPESVKITIGRNETKRTE